MLAAADPDKNRDLHRAIRYKSPALFYFQILILLKFSSSGNALANEQSGGAFHSYPFRVSKVVSVSPNLNIRILGFRDKCI
jgi:hypothetical protein